MTQSEVWRELQRREVVRAVIRDEIKLHHEDGSVTTLFVGPLADGLRKDLGTSAIWNVDTKLITFIL